MSMYARERRRQEQLPHGRENVYQYRNTEPQPRDGVPLRGGTLALGGEADGPNGGTPPRLPPNCWRSWTVCPTRQRRVLVTNMARAAWQRLGAEMNYLALAAWSFSAASMRSLSLTMS